MFYGFANIVRIKSILKVCLVCESFKNSTLGLSIDLNIQCRSVFMAKGGYSGGV